MAVEAKLKPRLRGVSHHAAFYAAMGAGVTLLLAAPTQRAMAAVAVYVLTLMALFGVSALYHRIQWSEAARARMKRLDHAMIFLFIAGSYTPICLLALEGEPGRTLLMWVWIGAALGVVRAVAWPTAPKAIAALLYVALGMLVVAFFPDVAAGVGPFGAGALVTGGVLYAMGAAVYATQKPDPAPHVFGYHEVFHALVIVACVCHFAAIARVVLAAG